MIQASSLILAKTAASRDHSNIVLFIPQETDPKSSQVACNQKFLENPIELWS